MEYKEKIIVLVGRQNVGKSTLFNRLIKKNKAIVDSFPGVTRDLVYGNFEISGIKIKLIDSGGITDENNELNLLVQQKTLEAQKNADLILFLTEAGNPIPIEKEYLSSIKKMGKKIILVMNKCDSPEKEIFINDFYTYGAGEALPISAQHNRNIDRLLEKINTLIKTDAVALPGDQMNSQECPIRIALVGKPNVGKSSLLNKLVNKERSIVSSIPGTTRDIVDEEFVFENNHFILVDTAGMRRKSKIDSDLEYYSVNRAVKSIVSADIVFLIIDSLQELSDQDKKITDQITNHNKGLIVVLNKCDLHKENNIILKDTIEQIHYKFPIINYAPIIPISAKTGNGLIKLLKTALKIYKNLHRRIETAELNFFIQEITNKYHPSSKKGMIRIYYGTQVSVAPIEFIFFINKKNLLSNSYKHYILNRLREKFDYAGIPIKITYKGKSKNTD